MTHSHWLRFPFAIALIAIIAAAPPALAAPPRTVDEHRPADLQGQVEVINVAGRIEVVGWDKAEVAVTGTIGSGVERLEFTGGGARTTVRVVSRSLYGLHFGWNSNAEQANLVVHVPQRSSLTAQLVSSDLLVTSVAGDQELRTVSGDVNAAVQHEVRVHTVSGDIKLNAGSDTRLIEVASVSGDLQLTGGAGGELSVKTVSGDSVLRMGTASRVHLKTVSGDFTVALGLAADGRFEAESISGDLRVDFAGALPPAEYDLQTFSGDLDTCTGRKGAREGYGPGNRLNFREAAGTARVRVDTKSGDVHLCSH